MKILDSVEMSGYEINVKWTWQNIAYEASGSFVVEFSGDYVHSVRVELLEPVTGCLGALMHEIEEYILKHGNYYAWDQDRIAAQGDRMRDAALFD